MATSKQPKFNFAESNIAMLGTALEKEIRKGSSLLEPAWQDVGKAPGLWVWRIENFKVVAWPREEYGCFFQGDSFIILHSKGARELIHSVHFWLGNESSADECGTAAYKTVELANVLVGSITQYRELQGSESKEFLSYFPTLTIKPGGVPSGFIHVGEVAFRKRLLQFKGIRNHVAVSEQPLTNSLNSGDAFVLDADNKIFVWDGSRASVNEKVMAGNFAESLKNERNGKPKVIRVREDVHDSDSRLFWEELGQKHREVKDAKDGGEDTNVTVIKRLFRLQETEAGLSLEKVAEHEVFKRDFDSGHVYIFDVGFEIFIYVGSQATMLPRIRAHHYVQTYLLENNRPLDTTVNRILEGSTVASIVFDSQLSVDNSLGENVAELIRKRSNRRKSIEKSEEENLKLVEALPDVTPEPTIADSITKDIAATVFRRVSQRKEKEKKNLNNEATSLYIEPKASETLSPDIQRTISERRKKRISRLTGGEECDLSGSPSPTSPLSPQTASPKSSGSEESVQQNIEPSPVVENTVAHNIELESVQPVEPVADNNIDADPPTKVEEDKTSLSSEQDQNTKVDEAPSFIISTPSQVELVILPDTLSEAEYEAEATRKKEEAEAARKKEEALELLLKQAQEEREKYKEETEKLKKQLEELQSHASSEPNITSPPPPTTTTSTITSSPVVPPSSSLLTAKSPSPSPAHSDDDFSEDDDSMVVLDAQQIQADILADKKRKKNKSKSKETSPFLLLPGILSSSEQPSDAHHHHRQEQRSPSPVATDAVSPTTEEGGATVKRRSSWAGKAVKWITGQTTKPDA